MSHFDDAVQHIGTSALEAASTVPEKVTQQFLNELTDNRAVLVFGRGRSGLVGEAFVIRLHHLGISAYFVGEAVTPPVGQEDVVVCLSGSGETFSVVVTARVAKELGATVVAITGDPTSSLAEHADLVVRITRGDPDRALAPLGTLFEVTSHLYFDAIIAELMDRLGQGEDDLRARHATLE